VQIGCNAVRWGLSLQSGSLIGNTQTPIWQNLVSSIYRCVYVQIGCNAVSWGPYLQPGSLIGHGQNPVKRFVSGGCDNLVKIWRWVVSTAEYFWYCVKTDLEWLLSNLACLIHWWIIRRIGRVANWRFKMSRKLNMEFSRNLAVTKILFGSVALILRIRH